MCLGSNPLFYRLLLRHSQKAQKIVDDRLGLNFFIFKHFDVNSSIIWRFKNRNPLLDWFGKIRKLKTLAFPFDLRGTLLSFAFSFFFAFFLCYQILFIPFFLFHMSLWKKNRSKRILIWKKSEKPNTSCIFSRNSFSRFIDSCKLLFSNKPPFLLLLLSFPSSSKSLSQSSSVKNNFLWNENNVLWNQEKKNCNSSRFQ